MNPFHSLVLKAHDALKNLFKTVLSISTFNRLLHFEETQPIHVKHFKCFIENKWFWNTKNVIMSICTRLQVCSYYIYDISLLWSPSVYRILVLTDLVSNKSPILFLTNSCFRIVSDVGKENVWSSLLHWPLSRFVWYV